MVSISAFLPSLRPAAGRRRVPGWMAIVCLLVALFAPEVEALARPAADDPFAALCAGSAGGADSHPYGNACPSCTLAHSAPTLGTWGGATTVVAYAPPVPGEGLMAGVRTGDARAPTARGPPLAA